MFRHLMSACVGAGLGLVALTPAHAQNFTLLAGWGENNVNAYGTCQ